MNLDSICLDFFNICEILASFLIFSAHISYLNDTAAGLTCNKVLAAFYNLILFMENLNV